MPRPRLRVCAWLIGVVASGASCVAAPSQDRPASEPARPGQASAAETPSRTVVRTAVLTFVDRRRVVRRGDGSTASRRLVTVVRYPERVGGRSSGEVRPRPLIVFGHGFALSPRPYVRLLRHWARAGYVVAAPAFPGERAGAPGGPVRTDLINQPADVKFVIGRLLRASEATGGRLAGTIDGDRIAVAGHSDGGNTALAVAYDPRFRSRRIDAAVILAGADLPGIAPFRFPASGPPLLAVQGSADVINPPRDTARFFARAQPPKLLLTLQRSGHFAPYMTQQPQLAVVSRVTTAFLDQVFRMGDASDSRLDALGNRAGVSRLRIVR